MSGFLPDRASSSLANCWSVAGSDGTLREAGIRVLAIEDNAANLRILRRWMNRYRFTLHTATDGGTGLSEALRLQPDVVLLDMGMPVMDGWEVARRLRADDAGRDLFIIAVTAHASDQDRRRCFEAGCDLFFSKPVDFRGLCEVILSRGHVSVSS